MKWHKLLITLMMVAAILFGSGPAKTGITLAASEPDTPASLVRAQGSGLQRIRFARGATSAEVSGDLGARSSARYVLRALAGQLMEVTLTASQGATLAVTMAAGRALTPIASSSTSFRGYLPANGDYILTITSRRQPISYSLYVSIPQRIAFERGATSATLDGDLEAYQGHDYILRAQAGQLMEIEVISDQPATENNLQLIIYGADGSVLRSGMGEGSSFRGELPLSQDYLVTVRAGGQYVSFTMSVIIPQRINFRRGAISATLEGSLRASHSQFYVLRALKGQTMRVRVTPRDDVQLIVYGADGTVLKSGMDEGARFTGELPSTQDYILVVRAGAEAEVYTLKVTIR